MPNNFPPELRRKLYPGSLKSLNFINIIIITLGGPGVRRKKKIIRPFHVLSRGGWADFFEVRFGNRERAHARR